MATKNIVPRANNEGTLGTSEKQWSNVHTKDIALNGVSLNEKLTTLMSKEDGGVFTGQIRFTQSVGINDIQVGSYKDLVFNDENGTRIGILRANNNDAAQKHQIALGVIDNNNTSKGGITVSYDEVAGKVKITSITPDKAANDTQLATTAYVKSNLNDYLPLSGGTVGGWLTFSGNPRLRHEGTTSSLELYGGTAYNNGAYLRLNGKDKEAGQFDIHAHDGTNTKVLVGKANGPLTWGGQNISLEGHTHNYLPLDGSLTTQLVINRNNSSVDGGVKLTGAGQNYAVNILNTNVTKGTIPSSKQYWGINFYGKDSASYNQRVGMIETVLDTNNLSETSLRAYNCTSNTNNTHCTISCFVDGNGNAYTYAPTPATADNSTKIATTAFVKAQGYSTKSGHTWATTKATTTSSASTNNPVVVTQNYNNGKNWYRVWSDGWIEQGGYISGTRASGAWFVVNFLKNFTSSNRMVMLSRAETGIVDEGNVPILLDTDNSTNSFKCYINNTTSTRLWWYACGY